MVHRDHINLSTTLFYTLFLSAVPLPVIFSAGNYAYIPFLFGSLLPDLDIGIYDRGHRTRSPMHNMGYSLLFALFFGLLALCLYTFFPEKAVIAGRGTGLAPLLKDFGLYKSVLVLFLISCGWTAHLCGDFIQGGVKFFSAKIGMSRLTWNVYYGDSTSLFNITHISAYTGWLLLLAAPAVMFLARLKNPGFVRLFPVALYFACLGTGGAGRALAVFFTACAALGASFLFLNLSGVPFL